MYNSCFNQAVVDHDATLLETDMAAVKSSVANIIVADKSQNGVPLLCARVVGRWLFCRDRS